MDTPHADRASPSSPPADVVLHQTRRAGGYWARRALGVGYLDDGHSEVRWPITTSRSHSVLDCSTVVNEQAHNLQLLQSAPVRDRCALRAVFPTPASWRVKPASLTLSGRVTSHFITRNGVLPPASTLKTVLARRGPNHPPPLTRLFESRSRGVGFSGGRTPARLLHVYSLGPD
uniref:Uncharacterized protein n=1 Tax=Mycena chlorophos TaxID=658473 RepID=A0ABQ0LG78_MYCCL|nr:predicted protein [Mycena chlorophos]